MAYKNIYGTGGVVFQDLINQGQYIYFPTAVATIQKKRVYKELTQNKGKTSQRNKGVRLYHNITIYNYCEDDWVNIQKLLHNISYMTNQSGLDKSMYYYPKVDDLYEGFDVNYTSYRIIADGMTIKFKKIADSISQGEILKITFTSIGLESKLKVNTAISNDTIVDHNNSNIIDSRGNRLIAFKED